LRSYLRVLVLYWKVVAAGLILGLATAAAVTFTATPTYASQVTLFLSVPGAPDPTNAADKARSYVELLTNERLSADVVESLGLDQEPSALADRITARLEADTVLITVRVTDSSAAGAQQIAGALSAAFVAIVAELEQPAATPEPAPPADGLVPPPAAQAPPAVPAPSVTVTVVQPATLSPAPVSPVPALNLALGAILGVLAGIGGALAVNSAGGPVRSLDELTEVTGAAALGGVWNDPGAHAKPLAIIGDPNGSRAEGYRAIRTRLLSSGVAYRTVAVVSPHHADGKTATACNLAVGLAQTGRKVALVDGNIRGPGVMDYLGEHARKAESAAGGSGSLGSGGLSGVLTGALPSAAAMRPVGPKGFDVLEAGRWFVGLSELLSSPSMEFLLDELAGSYDTVIVDTAALLHCSDGPTLAALCDTTIMVARHGQTKRKDLQAATDLLRSMSTVMIGGVLSRSPRSGARSGVRAGRVAERVQRATVPPEAARIPPRHAAADGPADHDGWVRPGAANGATTAPGEQPPPTLGGAGASRP
jgi:Mrp family chromosome partitioning ATPase/capsular polysaccharide biosynthesis protein